MKMIQVGKYGSIVISVIINILPKQAHLGTMRTYIGALAPIPKLMFTVIFGLEMMVIDWRNTFLGIKTSWGSSRTYEGGGHRAFRLILNSCSLMVMIFLKNQKEK